MQTANGRYLGSDRSPLVLQKVANQFLCHGSKQRLECDQN
jgi:hypothetical protein